MKHEFYLTCPPGLEFVSEEEVERKIKGKVSESRNGKGRVFFTADYDKIPQMNCSLRTAERVVLLLSREFIESLEDIYRVVRSLDFSFIKPEWSFAIRSVRVGEHDFTSIDIGRIAGKAVIDSYLESNGVRLKVNLDQPDVIIRCDLVENDFVVGIDMTGDEGLHKRGYRVYEHPAPLNPCIASALIYISGWSHEYTLLDPFCGSGTILVEAGMIAKNIPICKFRKEFSFLKFFDEIPDYEEKEVDLKLFGVERFIKHIEGAKKISEFTGIDIKLIQGYAEKIHEYFDSIDFVATNPPYGLRIGRKKIIEDLYRGFLDSLSKILEKRAVVITAERSIFERYAEEFFHDFRRYDVRYGGLLTGVYVLE